MFPGRLSAVASGVWSDYLWKRLRPSMVSRSGLTVSLRSRSDWDIFAEIWASAEYDQAILRALGSSGTGAVQIVDLGANVGLFSLRCIELARLSGLVRPLHIVAVEGVPRIFDILKRNLNGPGENVLLSLHRGLVGERSGSTHISDTSYAGANSIVRDGEKVSRLPFRGAHAVRSEYLDLDDILSRDVGIDLLKCDIEGSEAAFLRNYPGVLARTRLMALEIHPLRCDPAACRRALAEAGLRKDLVLRSSDTMALEIYSQTGAPVASS